MLFEIGYFSLNWNVLEAGFQNGFDTASQFTDCEYGIDGFHGEEYI